MRLNETLQICLLALVSRHPEHTLDINEDILGRQSLGTDGWKASDLLDLLQRTQPEILQAKALLVLEQQECSMYLLSRSEETPALCIHGQGELPPYQGNMDVRREKIQLLHSQGGIPMFRRILVPLDGSSLAEHALPLAARLAKVSGGTVTLLHISSITMEYGPSLAQPFMYAQSMLEDEIAQGRLYLDDIARSPVLKDITVHKEEISGEVAQGILDFAQSDATDLMVICSHGRTGFKRWALGSIAQKVARYSTKPVLIVNSGYTTFPATAMVSTHPISILVGLDGSALAETVLLPAAQLSAALNAPENGILHLLRVVEVIQEMRDESAATMNERNEQTIAEARTYLHKVEQRLQGGDLAQFHVTVSSSTAASYDTADTLVREAEQDEQCDDGTEQEGCALIALATHGRGGLKRWVMGSVTERVLGSTKLPMLIVRSTEAEAAILPQKELVQQGTL